jgi:Protein of unknown function (DUF3800)
MAMYSAYFDDSGHPDDSAYVAVAGCVADVNQWVHFEREWLQLLAPFQTKLFHAVDFEQRKPPFDNLTDVERRDFLRLLIGIIHRRVEKQISHIIPMDVYRLLNAKYIFAECYGYPYPSAARVCMAGVSEWANYYAIPDEQIKYFFENGAKHKGQIEWIAERDKLPIPLFPSKADAVPLQAADLIAWLQTKALNGSASALHRDLIERLERHPHDWSSLNYETGEALAKWAVIALRDPWFNYRGKIVTKDGKRKAIVHYWPKHKGKEPKVERKKLVLAEPLPPLSQCTEEEIAQSEILTAFARISRGLKPVS